MKKISEEFGPIPKEVLEVSQKLKDSGFEAYLIGGCRVTADVADPENCGLCLMRIAKYIDNNRRPCVHMLTYPHTTFNVILRIEFWKRAIPMLEAMPSHRFERKVIAKKAVAFPELWALDKCVKYENPSPHSW